MTFLQSIFLFGLFAAILPLLIHLFSRRKKERIPFSSLYFLKLIESKKIRRLKLKQIVLLLLRMAIVGFLVLAFARPTLTGEFGSRYSEDTPISAVIIVDNSLSTAADSPERDGTPQFELLRQKALYILETLKDGDEIFLLFSTELDPAPKLQGPSPYDSQIKLSVPPEERFKPVFDIDVVRRQMQSARVSNKTADLLNALQIGYSLLESSTNLYREIFLISDMQAANFPPNPTPNAQGAFPIRSTLRRTGQNESEIDPSVSIQASSAQESPMQKSPIHVYCIKPDGESPDNVGITGAVIQNQIVEQGKQITLRATIQNFSDRPVSRSAGLVNLYLDGHRVAQKNVTLAAEEFESIDFQVIPERTGIIEGMVEIEDDALAEDNQRHFVITIPDTIALLIINGNDDAIAFLQSVYAPEFAQRFSVQTISEQQISSVDFKSFDLVIYNGFTRMTQADIYRIRNFCAGGGGIIIFPGEHSDLVSFNESVGKAFSLPKATGFSGNLMRRAAPADDFYVVEKIDFSHSLFVNMFKQDQPELNMPQIFRSIDFVSPQERYSRSIMTLSNNRPFLTETRVEQGAIVLFASSPSLSWSTFPLKGMFAPLMHRLAYYFTRSGSMDNGELIIGDPITFLYHGKADNLSMTPPIGERYRLSPSVSSEAFRVTFTETDNPGIYSFTSGDEVSRKFAVNTNVRESDLRSISMERLKTIFGDRPFFTFFQNNSNENISEQIREARSGREISRYCVMAVLVLLLLETAIQHEKKGKEKSEETSG